MRSGAETAQRGQGSLGGPGPPRRTPVTIAAWPPEISPAPLLVLQVGLLGRVQGHLQPSLASCPGREGRHREAGVLSRRLVVEVGDARRRLDFASLVCTRSCVSNRK